MSGYNFRTSLSGSEVRLSFEIGDEMQNLAICRPRLTFDANGDGVREDAWHGWDEQLVAADADRALSKPLGPDRTTLPAWVERPTVPWQLWTCGYECADQGIVVRWDVEEGFERP